MVCLRRRPTGGVVWNANRGAISRRAIMRGKAVDVGRQFEGVNAFERALPAMVRLAEIFVVLDHGAILAVGQPSEIINNGGVIEAYLGKKWAAIRALD